MWLSPIKTKTRLDDDQETSQYHVANDLKCRAGTRKGAGIVDQDRHAGSPGLYLLFATGKRSDRAAMKEFFAAQSTVLLSHDPCDATPLQLVDADHMQSDKPANFANPEAQEHAWMELLREGLTFDLEGIAPGPASEFPEIEYRFDLEQAPNGFRFDAMRIAVGQHLSGGERSLPIMRGMVGLARDLTHHFDDVEAVVWSPSKSAIGRQYFESISTAWIEGGSFPALGLTAFRETIDGALQTVGLDYWIGQELRIEPPLADGKVTATRLGVRLVNQLILARGLKEIERIVAPDGSRLMMRPSKNGKFVRVWRE